jgi:glycosyl transferase family 25
MLISEVVQCYTQINIKQYNKNNIIMQSFGDIKNILYINLDHREDRKLHIESELSKMGWMGERFSAIKDDNGAIGCAKSQVACLQIALDRGWDHVLICEDDLTFINPEVLKRNLDRFLQKKREHVWDVVLLAGNNFPPSEIEDDVSIRIRNCQCACGYLVNMHYIKTLLDKWKEGTELFIQDPRNGPIYAIDIYWKRLQLVDYWYLIIPICAIQKPSYSDIEKRDVDYTHTMINIKLKRKKWGMSFN